MFDTPPTPPPNLGVITEHQIRTHQELMTDLFVKNKKAKTRMIKDLPTFTTINPVNIEKDLDRLLDDSRVQLNKLKAIESVSWNNFAYPLQTIYKNLNDFFSPISHLNAVKDTEALRKAYETCLPKLSAFYTEAAQDTALFQHIESLQSLSLKPIQLRWVTLQLQDLNLSGVGLKTENKTRFKTIQMRLSELSQRFNNNILDATKAYQKHILDLTILKGIPAANLALFKQKAEDSHKKGYLLGIDYPSVHAVLTYAENRELREEIYTASNTKASDQSTEGKQFDNATIIDEILALKLDAANLLGFNHYADNSLAAKMAKDVPEVLSFLNDLGKQTKPFAEKEIVTLRAFAKEALGITDLQAWDFGFVSEKYREQYFSLSEEVIRQYFPADKVLEGLFTLVNRLFDIHITEITHFDTYHKDVRLFQVEKNKKVIAKFYFDLYARDAKKQGAWMSGARSSFQFKDGAQQIPVAFLTTNFRQGAKGKPALLSHREVQTLFHEFGHGLHHMLTTVDIQGIGGISGVEWDAVELPSQLLENWCWEPKVLSLISSHIDTHKPLPPELLDALLKARDFNQGYTMLRQLEFAIFDIKLHALTEAPNTSQVQALLDSVRRDTSLLMPPPSNRFQNGFSHIFAGGYAAGYYSYKWAEVLSSDVFSQFEKNGIFDKKTGQTFVNEILSQGASRPMDEAFFAFMGRKPDTSALLRHSGLIKK